MFHSCITCRRAFSLFFFVEEKPFPPPPFCSCFCGTFLLYVRTCCHQAAKQATTCPPDRGNVSQQPTQANRQKLARVRMSSSLHTARWVLQTNEDIETCPAYDVPKKNEMFSYSHVGALGVRNRLSLCPVHSYFPFFPCERASAARGAKRFVKSLRNLRGQFISTA